MSTLLNESSPRTTSAGGFPTVSIGLPTYNGEHRISAAIVSILNQGYPNLEIIISDNCSTDRTAEVCSTLWVNNPSIHYFRQKENIGITSNFEFVLRKATGDLFMWISDDDSLEPGTLHKYVDFLSRHPGYSLVSGQIQYWSGRQRVFVERDLGAEKNARTARVAGYYRNVVHGAAFYGLMARKLAQKLHLQNRVGEDWHFVAKAAYLGKIKMLDSIGYHKKLNGSSKTLRHYAKLIGASWFSATFPHVRIALDAFSDILTSPIYKEQRWPERLFLALVACVGVLANHYKRYPYMVGGNLLRMLGFKKRQRITRGDKLEETWAW